MTGWAAIGGPQTIRTRVRGDRMRVLTATNETQGWRDDDFCWTVEGELVLLPPIECADRECGCSRGMAGAASHRGTTTVKVIERADLNAAGYQELITDALQSSGYVTEALLSDPEVKEWVRGEASSLTRMAAAFPVGTVLERRGRFLWRRTGPDDRYDEG